jgi:prophage regulatory protein
VGTSEEPPLIRADYWRAKNTTSSAALRRENWILKEKPSNEPEVLHAMAKRILRKDGVLERTGLSQSQLYESIRDKTFPQAVPLGIRTVGWLEEEVEAWIEGRIKARDAASSRRHGGPGRGHKGPMTPVTA